MVETDIADYVRWFTTETEWLDWDEPWDPIQTDDVTEQNRWTKCWMSALVLSEESPRKRFEVEAEGRHIGCVLSYRVDENFSWIPEEGIHAGQAAYTAIGIDICDPIMQGKGYGTQAMKVFLQYLCSLGCKDLYVDTWSGNLRVIRMMNKTKFSLYRRIPERWTVRGKQYDELIYRYIGCDKEG